MKKSLRKLTAADQSSSSQYKLFKLAVFWPYPNGFDGLDISYARDEDLLYWKERGKEISLWTINKTENIKHYLDLDVDFITTDFPFLCMRLKD